MVLGLPHPSEVLQVWKIGSYDFFTVQMHSSGDATDLQSSGNIAFEKYRISVGYISGSSSEEELSRSSHEMH